MSVVRGTTPTFLLQFPQSVDLTNADNVYVTFDNAKGYTLTKSGADIEVEPQTVSVFLTQDETFRLGVGNIQIQVNWTFGNGLRAATEIATYEMSKQLLMEVVK